MGVMAAEAEMEVEVLTVGLVAEVETGAVRVVDATALEVMEVAAAELDLVGMVAAMAAMAARVAARVAAATVVARACRYKYPVGGNTCSDGMCTRPVPLPRRPSPR